VLSLQLAPVPHLVTLVAVAAVLVAGIRLRFLDIPLAREGEEVTVVRCAAQFAKGEELGWFEHGSTILVLAPPGFALSEQVGEGKLVKMGQPLLLHPEAKGPVARDWA